MFANDWHESIQLAYADAYRPDELGTPANCIVGTDCIDLIGLAGIKDNKRAVLILAGEHDWFDGDTSPQFPLEGFDGDFGDELDDVFNLENSDLDNVFDIRTVDVVGVGDSERDKFLIVEEL
jgi:hypothetical protein